MNFVLSYACLEGLRFPWALCFSLVGQELDIVYWILLSTVLSALRTQRFPNLHGTNPKWSQKVVPSSPFMGLFTQFGTISWNLYVDQYLKKRGERPSTDLWRSFYIQFSLCSTVSCELWSILGLHWLWAFFPQHRISSLLWLGSSFSVHAHEFTEGLLWLASPFSGIIMLPDNAGKLLLHLLCLVLFCCVVFEEKKTESLLHQLWNYQYNFRFCNLLQTGPRSLYLVLWCAMYPSTFEI